VTAHIKPTHDSAKARALRVVNRGMGYCYRCGMPWNLIEPHITNYKFGSGCFPLCEECWTTLGCPEARIEYYEMLYNKWWSMRHEKGPLIDEQHDEYLQELIDDKALIGKAVANGL
jgi:hypothetical protein